MRVELLHIDDCPGWREALDRLRGALDAAGLAATPIEVLPIRTDAEAAAARFSGSPTILVDGEDLFPAPELDELACRVYLTDAGLSPAPTRAQVEAALRTRLDRRRGAAASD